MPATLGRRPGIYVDERTRYVTAWLPKRVSLGAILQALEEPAFTARIDRIFLLKPVSRFC